LLALRLGQNEWRYMAMMVLHLAMLFHPILLFF
jgi:hypothetical protein